jgi:hypothetical protein
MEQLDTSILEGLYWVRESDKLLAKTLQQQLIDLFYPPNMR